MRVFLRQRRQDPRACRDRSTCIISHPGTPRHILLFLIIITTWITVITLQWEREASLFLQQRAPGNPTPQLHYDGVSLAITLQMSTDTSDPFNYRDITVGSGHFYHHVRGSGFATGHRWSKSGAYGSVANDTDELTLTCFSLGPLGWAHQPPHGLVSAVAVLLVEAVPAAWTWTHKKNNMDHFSRILSRILNLGTKGET